MQLVSKAYTLVIAALFIAAAACQAEAQEKRHKLGGIGNAVGFVVDAETGAYLQDCRVVLTLPDSVEPISGSNSATTKEGYYQIRASLGASSTRFATERIFELSIASLLLGGGKHTDRFINVSQLVLNVSKEGYKPFHGPVPVTSANLEMNHVWLAPVRLAPQSATYPSYNNVDFRLGKVDSIDLDTLTPEPGKDVHFKLTVSGMPEKPKAHPVLQCFLAGTLTDATVKETVTGDEHTFEGRIGMKSTEFGIFGNKHRAVSAGLRGIDFTFGFPGADKYLLDRPLTPLGRRQYVAVGVPSDKKPDAERALGTINRKLLTAEDVAEEDDDTVSERKQGLAESVKSVNAIFPKAPAEPGSGQDGVSLFISGQHTAAWDKEKRMEKALREVVGDPLIDVMKYSAAVEKNPADFHSRALCLQARHDLLAGKQRLRPDLIAAVRDLQLPAMPAPQKPEEKLYAAQALLQLGKDAEADGLLRELTEDPKVGLQAKLMLAEGMYARREFAAAAPLYEQAFGAPKAKDVRGFYPYLNYARLLLTNGDAAKAEEFFAKALAHGRFPSQDFSRPATTGLIGSQSYQLYSSASRSGSIGYAFPEGAAVQWLLTNYECLAQPEHDWLGAAIAARALSDLGLTDMALAQAKKTLALQPEDQYVLATCALVQKRAGDAAASSETLAHLLKINPRHPEGLLLSH